MVVQNTKTAFITTLNAYIALTKPKIIILLLVTSVGGMFLAEKGIGSFLNNQRIRVSARPDIKNCIVFKKASCEKSV